MVHLAGGQRMRTCCKCSSYYCFLVGSDVLIVLGALHVAFHVIVVLVVIGVAVLVVFVVLVVLLVLVAIGVLVVNVVIVIQYFIVLIVVVVLVGVPFCCACSYHYCS